VPTPHVIEAFPDELPVHVKDDVRREERQDTIPVQAL
jgi:hypothetical protein